MPSSCTLRPSVKYRISWHWSNFCPSCDTNPELHHYILSSSLNKASLYTAANNSTTLRESIIPWPAEFMIQTTGVQPIKIIRTRESPPVSSIWLRRPRLSTSDKSGLFRSPEVHLSFEPDPDPPPSSRKCSGNTPPWYNFTNLMQKLLPPEFFLPPSRNVLEAKVFSHDSIIHLWPTSSTTFCR